MHRYQIEERIGEGNFGSVLRASFIETGHLVAIKKISLCRLQDGMPNNSLREVKALQLLQNDHPNILKLYEVFPHGSAVALVTELLETDLADVIRSSKRALTESQAKAYLQMLLHALQHCHKHRVIHRDVKPGNCLISRDGQLKLADFGLARVFHDDGRPMTHEVATRWYRAPELLFGSRKYTNTVDMWAAGCVFAEMMLAMPLFPGEGDIDQINKIFQTLGTPDEMTWPGIWELPDWNKIQFPKSEGKGLRNILINSSAPAVHLLGTLLLYDPVRRATATGALADPYFITEPLPMQPDPAADLIEGRPGLLVLSQPKGKLKPWEYEEFIDAPFAWPVSPRDNRPDFFDEENDETPPSSAASSADEQAESVAQVIPITPSELSVMSPHDLQ
uniref:[RNA-polymerase]-subunit kinase n=1 Tax=Eutreptiella gymnastica TaxID=73025 RepID=A0A7S4GJF2_9EUGL